MIGASCKEIEKGCQGFDPEVDIDQFNPCFLPVRFGDVIRAYIILKGVDCKYFHLMAFADETLHDHVHRYGASFSWWEGGFVTNHQDVHETSLVGILSILRINFNQASRSNSEASMVAL